MEHGILSSFSFAEIRDQHGSAVEGREVVRSRKCKAFAHNLSLHDTCHIVMFPDTGNICRRKKKTTYGFLMYAASPPRHWSLHAHIYAHTHTHQKQTVSKSTFFSTQLKINHILGAFCC